MAIWDRFISSKDSDEKKAKESWDRAIKYFDGGLNNRALKDLGDALTLNPGYGPEAMELMQTFSSQGNEEMALSVGYALLKLDPKNFELMNQLGNSLRNSNSFSKAKKLYTYALKINSNYTEAKYNLAASTFRITTNDAALISQTRKVEVLQEFRRYVFQGNRADFFPVPNEELGEDTSATKKKEGEEDEEELTDEARQQLLDGFIQQLKGDVESMGENWESLFNLALMYDLNDMGTLAIQYYNKALEKDPENRMVTSNLAVALAVHEDKIGEAEALLLKNLTQHRFDRTTVLDLALIYRKTGKQFQTLKFFTYIGDLLAKSMGKFETDKVEAHAREMFEKRKYYDAIPVFENLANEKQEDYWYEKLTVMYLNQKNEEKYLQTFKRLLKINPEHKEAQEKLTEYAGNYDAESKEKLGKGSVRYAIELMLKAVKIEETPERWMDLAQMYQDDGEEILAENALKRWKQLTSAAGEGAGEPEQASAS
ncbi:MAG: hypothetical protein O7A69_10645 [SAR324 cluster bacterium]|nr:hypothetical protein [SAR324 cluster bacterium]